MSLYDTIKISDNPQRSFEEIITFKSRDNRYLLQVLLELSPICNFTCPFCYVRKTPKELLDQGKSILRFSYWKDILDQLFDMGVMYVGFTGGECMLHPDFVEIYEYAAQKGFFLSMITNGSCLTDRILDAFKKYSPVKISITIYGGSETTYQKVCGNGDYFNRVMTNLHRLSEAKIPFSLQMTVSRDNVRDIPKVYEFGKRFNVHLSFGHTLIACERCTKEIQEANRASDDEYREMMKILHRIDNIGVNASPMPVPPKINTNGVACSAGRSNAFINHEGLMQLCVSYHETTISTFEHTIKECWSKIVKAADQIPFIEECNGCIHAARCVQCFAVHYYDTGKYSTPSPKICFKRKHPEEAARIEAYYSEHGVLPSIEF